ncbi:unnamed protein product, partial [Brassica oleracea]
RESLQRLDTNYLIVPNTTWFDLSGNGITNSLLKMEYTMLKRGYPTFYDMPEEDQELWFRQFAQELGIRDYRTSENCFPPQSSFVLHQADQ